jgi:hypothetical protein
MASTFWYDGMNHYDFVAGTATTGKTVAQAAQSANFAQMVWKSSSKVGFGVFDKYVVAWYCETAGEPKNAAKSKLNVGKICYKHGYNRCYNDLALAAHNKMRKNHKADPVVFDEDAARAIQHELNRGDFKGQMPVITKRAKVFQGCGEAIFYQPDAKKKHEVSTSNIATDKWYSGINSYDFSSHTPKTAAGTEYTAEKGECRLTNNLFQIAAVLPADTYVQTTAIVARTLS